MRSRLSPLQMFTIKAQRAQYWTELNKLMKFSKHHLLRELTLANFCTRKTARNPTIHRMVQRENNPMKMWDKLISIALKSSTQVAQLKMTCMTRVKGQWRQMITVKTEIHFLYWLKASNQCLTKNSSRIRLVLGLSEIIFFWKKWYS